MSIMALASRAFKSVRGEGTLSQEWNAHGSKATCRGYTYLFSNQCCVLDDFILQRRDSQWHGFCWSMSSLVSVLPSTTSAGGLPLLFGCFAGVGSEVAHLRAGHRPPPKLYVRFSRILLSRSHKLRDTIPTLSSGAGTAPVRLI
jgi:hypothetical protein